MRQNIPADEQKMSEDELTRKIFADLILQRKEGDYDQRIAARNEMEKVFVTEFDRNPLNAYTFIPLNSGMYAVFNLEDK